MQNVDEKVKDKHWFWDRFPEHKKSGIACLSHDLINKSDQEEVEDLRLTKIAHKILFSPSYVSRCFKNFFKRSPYQLIKNRKIEAAKKLLLENPRLNMDEIAEKVGYNSGNYLIKVFRKTCKITPHQYRKKAIIEKKEFSAARAAIRKLAKKKKVRINRIAMHVSQQLYLFIRNQGVKKEDIRITLEPKDDRFFIVIYAPGKDKPHYFDIPADGEEDF